MRLGIMISVVAIALAGSAFARSPLIILNNYSPPLPTIELISMTPADHSQFSAAPTYVKAGFNLAIDQGKSDLTVFDPYNNAIAHRSPTSGDTSMEAALPAHLLDGTYRIDWKASCACAGNSVISGTSYFTIY